MANASPFPSIQGTTPNAGGCFESMPTPCDGVGMIGKGSMLNSGSIDLAANLAWPLPEIRGTGGVAYDSRRINGFVRRKAGPRESSVS
jgi:hypothetical protein